MEKVEKTSNGSIIFCSWLGAVPASFYFFVALATACYLSEERLAKEALSSRG